MSDYKRFISYLYDYENGIKKSNVGYARIESRNKQCKITVSLRVVGSTSNNLKCYIFKRFGAKIKCLSIGDGPVKSGSYELKIVTDSDNLMGSDYSIDDMGGIIVYSNVDKFFATEWDDKPIFLSQIEKLVSPSPQNTEDRIEEVGGTNGKSIDNVDKIKYVEDVEKSKDATYNEMIKVPDEIIENEYEINNDNNLNEATYDYESINADGMEHSVNKIIQMIQEEDDINKNYDNWNHPLQRNENESNRTNQEQEYSESNLGQNNSAKSLEELYNLIEQNYQRRNKYPEYHPALSNELRAELEKGTNHYRYNNENFSGEKANSNVLENNDYGYEEKPYYNNQINLNNVDNSNSSNIDYSNNSNIDYSNNENNAETENYNFDLSIETLKEIIKERLKDEATKTEQTESADVRKEPYNDQSPEYNLREEQMASYNSEEYDYYDNDNDKYDSDKYYNKLKNEGQVAKLISNNNKSVKIKPIEYQYYDYYNRPIIKWVDPNSIKKVKTYEYQLNEVFNIERSNKQLTNAQNSQNQTNQVNQATEEPLLDTIKVANQVPLDQEMSRRAYRIYEENHNQSGQPKEDWEDNLNNNINARNQSSPASESYPTNQVNSINPGIQSKDQSDKLNQSYELNQSDDDEKKSFNQYDASSMNVSELKLAQGNPGIPKEINDKIQIDELRKKDQIAKNYINTRYQTTGKKEDHRKENREKRAMNESVIANRIFESYPKLNAFADKEFEQCVRIEPQDLGLFPVDNWILGNNSFLLHGYYSYRHLLFAMKKNQNVCQYMLGVPGVYQNRERFVANMFGFHYFKPSKGKEVREGEFGYWYMEIKL